MRYPQLKSPGTSRKTISVFGGYDHNPRAADGSFYEMENMTSDHYPVLAPRGGRSVYAQGEDLGALIAKDCLCWVDSGDFVMNGYRVAMGLTAGEKRLVSMGAYVVIFPDKKYINTLDLTDFGDLEAAFVSTEDVSFTLCDQSGAAYTGCTASATAPEAPENGDYWLDTSSSPARLMRYSAQNCVWADIAATYVKISSPGIGAAFSQYDGVEVSGILPEALQDLNGELVLWDRGEDWLLVAGLIRDPITQSASDGAITVSRCLPELDFVIEAGNRLWGCRYGTDRKGNIVNEIYASKLGDFKNWSCYMGLSTDSYAASVGSDGAFTGAISHLGYPLFFKENYLHKVYGSYPAAYQLQATPCQGVRSGCHKSLAIVGDTLYYKSPEGICAYDGSLPVQVSRALGGVQYHSAVAGAHGSKYYVSMADGGGGAHLFVYDTYRQLWHREDSPHFSCFASCPEGFYALADGKIWDMLRGEEPVSWSVQTGVMGLDAPEQKYISRLTARLSLEPGSTVTFAVRYDFSPRWEHLATVQGKRLGSFTLPLRTRRCDHMELRISGTGAMKLYSLTKTWEKGSDTP